MYCSVDLKWLAAVAAVVIAVVILGVVYHRYRITKRRGMATAFENIRNYSMLHEWTVLSGWKVLIWNGHLTWTGCLWDPVTSPAPVSERRPTKHNDPWVFIMQYLGSVRQTFDPTRPKLLTDDPDIEMSYSNVAIHRNTAPYFSDKPAGSVARC